MAQNDQSTPGPKVQSAIKTKQQATENMPAANTLNLIAETAYCAVQQYCFRHYLGRFLSLLSFSNQ